MKLVRLASLVAAVGVTVGATCSDAAEWGVALYLAGDSDLWQTARHIGEQALARASARVGVVALVDGGCRWEEGARFVAKAGGVVAREGWGQVNTGQPETLRRFASAARRCIEAQRWMLIILGHGRPPAIMAGIWRMAPFAGGLAADWGSGHDGLTPRELAAALEGTRWDVVVTASCYSACVEYADALQGSARWMVAAPSEVPADGGIAAVTGRLDAASLRRSAFAAAEAAAAEMADGESDGESGHGVVVVDLRRVRKLVDSIGVLARGLAREPQIAATALVIADRQVGRWGPAGELVDVSALAGRLAELLPAGPLRDGALRVKEDANKAVVRREPRGLCDGGNERIGLGIYAPSPLAGPSDVYAKEAPVAIRTGWAELLRVVRDVTLEGFSALRRGGTDGPPADDRGRPLGGSLQ